MEIRDAVHGNIIIGEIEAGIIATPEMQRLRYIRQLDMTYLVFPGANHTRFEHSLGTMHVAGELAGKMSDKPEEELHIVGLLHDIGHGPFSHLTEHFTKKYLKLDHEQIGERMIRKSGIKEIIESGGLSFGKIMGYFRKTDRIDIVGGPLGADRIDYLMRDSYYTGVAYGIVDYDRTKSMVTPYEGRIAITEGGIPIAESLLIARYFMFTNVYYHHTKAIANKMLQRAVGSALENGEITADEMIDMNDWTLLERLKEYPLVDRIMKRNLYKRAYYENVDSDIDAAELESELIKSGFERDDFVIHVANISKSDNDIEVVDRDGKLVGTLAELSPFIKTLNEVLTRSRRLLVASDRSNAEKIGRAVRKLIE